jgi:hypothetical protein
MSATFLIMPQTKKEAGFASGLRIKQGGFTSREVSLGRYYARGWNNSLIAITKKHCNSRFCGAAMQNTHILTD